MTKCLKNADGSKMTKNRQKWLKNAKNASKMLKIAQKCNFFSFSTRRFAVALQLLELSHIIGPHKKPGHFSCTCHRNFFYII